MHGYHISSILGWNALTLTQLICKYKLQQRRTEYLLGFYWLESSTKEYCISAVHSGCGQKAITAERLAPPDYVMPFKKLHRFHISCWAYLGLQLGASEENPDIHAQSLFPLQAEFVCGDDERQTEGPPPWSALQKVSITSIFISEQNIWQLEARMVIFDVFKQILVFKRSRTRCCCSINYSRGELSTISVGGIFVLFNVQWSHYS